MRLIAGADRAAPAPTSSCFSPRRMFAYTIREGLGAVARSDPPRFALFGTALLMLVFGFGISTDVEYADVCRSRPRQCPKAVPISRSCAARPIRRRGADRRRCGLRTRAEERRGQRDHRNSAGLRPRHQARAARPRSRPGSTVPCPSAPRPFAAISQGMHQQYLADPAIRGHASWRAARGLPADHRDALPLQPGFRQHLRHGAVDHRAAAGAVPGHSDGAGDRARKGTGLDHQSLCDAGDAARIPARQADSLYRRGDGQFPRHVR